MSTFLTYIVAKQHIADLMADAQCQRVSRAFEVNRSSRRTARFAGALRGRRTEPPRRTPQPGADPAQKS